MAELEPATQRVVVVIDPVAAPEEAARLGVALAARLPSELEGLFVEDPELLRTAGLPFTRLICGTTAAFRPLASETVESTWRTQSRWARAVLEREAAPHHLLPRFSVRRGRRTVCVASVRATGAVVLIAAALPSSDRAPVWLLLTDRADAARAATVARVLAGDGPRPLRVVIEAPDAPSVELLSRHRIEGGATVVDRRLPRDMSDAVVRMLLNDAAGGTLVVPAGHPLADALAGFKVRSELPCQVILA